MRVARLTLLLVTIALAGCGSGTVKHVSQPRTSSASTAATPTKAAAVAAIPTGPGHLAAMAGRGGLTLRDRPGGKVVAHLRPTTEWGSPTGVWAAARGGRAARTPARGHGDVGRQQPRGLARQPARPPAHVALAVLAARGPLEPHD